MSVIKGYRTSDELKKLYDEFGEEDRRQLKADVSEVLKTGAGRLFLIAILWNENVFGTIGDGIESTSQIMIQVGRHNLAQDILAMANGVDYEAVALALRERNGILKERNRRIELIKNKLEEGRK